MFKGEMKESGQDAGGMEKEWFTLICESFINSDIGKNEFRNPIFRTVPINKY